MKMTISSVRKEYPKFFSDLMEDIMCVLGHSFKPFLKSTKERNQAYKFIHLHAYNTTAIATCGLHNIIIKKEPVKKELKRVKSKKSK